MDPDAEAERCAVAEKLSGDMEVGSASAALASVSLLHNTAYCWEYEPLCEVCCGIHAAAPAGLPYAPGIGAKSKA